MTATLIDLFAVAARKYADLDAIHVNDASVTYAEFDARANAVAEALLDRGVEHGDSVAVCLDRSVEYAAAVVGILKAGAVCLPLSPDEPSERNQEILRNGAAAALIAPRAAAERLDFAHPHFEVSDRVSTTAPAVVTVPGDAAFIFSTSGSTGRPKQVTLSHENCAVQIPWIVDAFGVGPGDRHLLKMSVNFVALVHGLLWPLLTGGSTVVVPPGRQTDLGYLARLTARKQITISTFIPSVMRLFLEQPEAASCTAVRHVLCAGEPLPPALQQRFFAIFPETALHNVFSSSEVPVVSHWRCKPGEERPAPMGYPVTDIVDVRVLNPDHTPTAPGEVGELHVSGPGVTLGYFGQAELNAGQFSEVGFRTGDLVRQDADGLLTSAGRADHLAKVRGFRIELGEVEASLGTHPDVRQAVAVVRESEGQSQLVAYVVGRAGRRELREHLASRLPEYMVPARFINLPEIPLSTNGKVDRGALPEPRESPVERTRPIVAPRDDMEAEILRIWQQVLDLDDISVQDSFTKDLGGDSLQAVDVASRLDSLLATELPFEVFQGAETIEELASACRRHLARR
ncbi:AMP-binding protein [Streptomyces tendae]|uniref:non-ribosomal peptide synthetase n=1 Tax=Streptomyces tendae TaxID=1932 RepID=UPI0036BE2787